MIKVIVITMEVVLVAVKYICVGDKDVCFGRYRNDKDRSDVDYCDGIDKIKMIALTCKPPRALFNDLLIIPPDYACLTYHSKYHDTTPYLLML